MVRHDVFRNIVGLVSNVVPVTMELNHGACALLKIINSSKVIKNVEQDAFNIPVNSSIR